MSEVEEKADINDESYQVVADRIEDFDFKLAADLMDCIAKCANIGVKATSIAGLAQAMLDEMNSEAKAIAVDRAEAAARVEKERQVRMAEEAQRRKEVEEAKEKAQREAADEEARVGTESKPKVIPAKDIPQPQRRL